jgi:hypothetical protein
LSRTERQALSILHEHGSLPGRRFFAAVKALEEQIFMGHNSFDRLIADLCSARHPLIQNNLGEAAITEAGRNVIEGAPTILNSTASIAGSAVSICRATKPSGVGFADPPAGLLTRVAPQRSLLERDLYLCKASGCCHVHRSDHPLNVTAQDRPLLIADHDEGDFSPSQVLLVTHVFVGCQQDVETCGLSLRYQFAVYQPIPSAFDGFNHNMTLEGITERGWGAVIKEYEHRPRALAAAMPGVRQDFGPRTRSPISPVHATNETIP